MLVEYVKNNYYAKSDPSYHWYRERHLSILLTWFQDPRYHRYRERHFNILLDVKF